MFIALSKRAVNSQRPTPNDDTKERLGVGSWRLAVQDNGCGRSRGAPGRPAFHRGEERRSPQEVANEKAQRQHQHRCAVETVASVGDGSYNGHSVFDKLYPANASYRPQWRARPHASRGTSLMPARHALSARAHTNTARRPLNLV